MCAASHLYHQCNHYSIPISKMLGIHKKAKGTSAWKQFSSLWQPFKPNKVGFASESGTALVLEFHMCFRSYYTSGSAPLYACVPSFFHSTCLPIYESHLFSPGCAGYCQEGETCFILLNDWMHSDTTYLHQIALSEDILHIFDRFTVQNGVKLWTTCSNFMICLISLVLSWKCEKGTISLEGHNMLRHHKAYIANYCIQECPCAYELCGTSGELMQHKHLGTHALWAPEMYIQGTSPLFCWEGSIIGTWITGCRGFQRDFRFPPGVTEFLQSHYAYRSR